MQQLVHGAKRDAIADVCTWAKVKRDERKRRRERKRETACRSHNVAFSTYARMHVRTCVPHTRAHSHARRRAYERRSYERSGARRRLNIGVSVGVIKRSLAPDEILRRTHEGRLKRNRSPPPSVTGLAPVFSTPLRFTAACANDILTARSRIVTESVWKASRHSKWINVRRTVIILSYYYYPTGVKWNEGKKVVEYERDLRYPVCFCKNWYFIFYCLLPTTCHSFSIL